MECPNSEYYRKLTEEELAADEYFQQWVLFPDQNNKHFWASFQKMHPEFTRKIETALQLVKEVANKKTIAPLSTHEKSFLKSIIYRELGFPDPVEYVVKKKVESKSTWMLAVAATVFIFVLITLLTNLSSSQKPTAIVRQFTKPGEVKEFMLPDSSTIVLNGGSSIEYAADFSSTSTREIILTGNAWFNVHKKTNGTPFIVHANDLNIVVTGTEFNVNAHSKATDVVLASGKINVTLKANMSKKAQLEPGQSLYLDANSQNFITTTVNTDVYTAAWKYKEWHFDETSLEQIASLIKKYYGVDVIFKNQAERKLMVTAVISVNDFQTLINILAKTLNINIQLENQQLTIY